jgi:hypothetical protein
MNIENFFNDFDQQNEKIKAEKEKRELELQQKLDDQQSFINTFKKYYENTLKNQLDTIAEKLSVKFEHSINEPQDFSGNNSLFELVLIPKFEHAVKEIKITIIVEGSRKLITLSANTKVSSSIYNVNNEHHGGFQTNFEEFVNINIEEKISELLSRIFIKKK